MKSLDPGRHQSAVAADGDTRHDVPADPTTQLGLDYRILQFVASKDWTWSKTWQMILIQLIPALPNPVSGLGAIMLTGAAIHSQLTVYGQSATVVGGAGLGFIIIGLALKFVRQRQRQRATRSSVGPGNDECLSG